VSPAEFLQFRNDIRASQESLARVLGVTRFTIIRWESGETAIPRTAELAVDTIRRHRAAMQGNHYPLMADVLRVMREEGIGQDDAIRAFGVEP